MTNPEDSEPPATEATRSRLPEYDRATTAVANFILPRLTASLHPVLEQMRQEENEHLPQGTVPAGVTHGMNRPIELRLKISLSKDAMARCDTEAWATMMWDAAQQALAAVVPQVHSFLEEVAQAGGNVVAARGRELDMDQVISMLERIPINFAEDGTPKFPTLFAHPADIERMRQHPPTEEQKRRFDELIMRKRAEFDARRRVRKLV